MLNTHLLDDYESVSQSNLDTFIHHLKERGKRWVFVGEEHGNRFAFSFIRELGLCLAQKTNGKGVALYTEALSSDWHYGLPYNDGLHDYTDEDGTTIRDAVMSWDVRGYKALFERLGKEMQIYGIDAPSQNYWESPEVRVDHWVGIIGRNSEELKLIQCGYDHIGFRGTDQPGSIVDRFLDDHIVTVRVLEFGGVQSPILLSSEEAYGSYGEPIDEIRLVGDPPGKRRVHHQGRFVSDYICLIPQQP